MELLYANLVIEDSVIFSYSKLILIWLISANEDLVIQDSFFGRWGLIKILLFRAYSNLVIQGSNDLVIEEPFKIGHSGNFQNLSCKCHSNAGYIIHSLKWPKVHQKVLNSEQKAW